MAIALKNLSRLCCTSDIAFTVGKTRYKFEIEGGPCFGLYTHSNIGEKNDHQLLYDVKADIYQISNSNALKTIEECNFNNLCSLTNFQLEEYLKEVSRVFKNTTSSIKSGVAISLSKTKRTWRYYRSGYVHYVELGSNKITITAKCLSNFGLRALLTFVRLSSEYPCALLLREVFNFRSFNLDKFARWSNLQLYQALSLRLNYNYDQGVYPSGVDTTEQIIKPLTLERLGLRVTLDTPEQGSTHNKVENIFQVVDRSANGIEKYPLPYWSQNDYYDEYLEEGIPYLYKYEDSEVIPNVFNSMPDANRYKDYFSILAVIENMWPKLVMDYPSQSK